MRRVGVRKVGAALAAGVLVATMAAALGGTAWGATTFVTCPPGTNLANAIANAHSGDTLIINGTCVGNFFIDKSLTLEGGTLDGGGSGRVLFIGRSAHVTLNGVKVQHGNFRGSGGGIFNQVGATLTLNSSTVSDNTAIDGGGIDSLGTLTIDRSTVSDNTAGEGGGIASLGTVTLTSSTVSNNTATNEGGGILSVNPVNPVTLTSSLVLNNTAFAGGGIYNNSRLTLAFSTVSNNTATNDGAGIYNDRASVTLQLTTVTVNHASGDGGGIDNDDFPGTVRLQLSAAVANTPDNCNGC